MYCQTRVGAVYRQTGTGAVYRHTRTGAMYRQTSGLKTEGGGACRAEELEQGLRDRGFPVENDTWAVLAADMQDKLSRELLQGSVVAAMLVRLPPPPTPCMHVGVRLYACAHACREGGDGEERVGKMWRRGAGQVNRMEDEAVMQRVGEKEAADEMAERGLNRKEYVPALARELLAVKLVTEALDSDALSLRVREVLSYPSSTPRSPWDSSADTTRRPPALRHAATALSALYCKTASSKCVLRLCTQSPSPVLPPTHSVRYVVCSSVRVCVPRARKRERVCVGLGGVCACLCVRVGGGVAGVLVLPLSPFIQLYISFPLFLSLRPLAQQPWPLPSVSESRG